MKQLQILERIDYFVSGIKKLTKKLTPTESFVGVNFIKNFLNAKNYLPSSIQENFLIG